jgi:hypothetical protein
MILPVRKQRVRAAGIPALFQQETSIDLPGRALPPGTTMPTRRERRQLTASGDGDTLLPSFQTY